MLYSFFAYYQVQIPFPAISSPTDKKTPNQPKTSKTKQLQKTKQKTQINKKSTNKKADKQTNPNPKQD